MSQTPERVDAAVSYSRADQGRVDSLIAGLKARGLAVWFDKDIPGGALWEEIIARKYRASSAVLFFVSKASLASQRCAEEVSTARTLGKPIIPILLDPLKLPDDLPDRFVLTLQARNTVDAHDRPEAAIQTAIIAALQGFGVTPGAAAPNGPTAAPVAPAAPPPKEEEKKRRGGAIWAFGGGLLALAIVAIAYVLFVLPQNVRDTQTRITAIPTAEPAAAPSPAATPQPETPPPPAPAGSPAKPATGDTTLVLDRTSYVEGDPIVASVKGLPGNNRDWVAVAKAGTPDNVYLTYVDSAGRKAGDFKLKPVMTAGKYEIRVFVEGNPKAEARQAITVTPFPPPTLTLDKTSYAEGEAITATVTGMLGTAKDWVALAKPDADPSVFLTYQYTNGGARAKVTLKPLMKPGKYEARVFFDDTSGDKTIRARVAFEIVPAEPVALMPDGDSYVPGADMDIAYSGMPGNARDWISIAKLGTPDTAYISYVNTDGKPAGTVALRAPEDEGVYELRAYFDDSTGDRTVRGRVRFEVREDAPTVPADPDPQTTPPEQPSETDPAAEPETPPVTDPVAEPTTPQPETAPATPEPSPQAEPVTGEDPDPDCSLPENVTAYPDRCVVNCAIPAHAAAFPDQCPAPP